MVVNSFGFLHYGAEGRCSNQETVTATMETAKTARNFVCTANSDFAIIQTLHSLNFDVPQTTLAVATRSSQE